MDQERVLRLFFDLVALSSPSLDERPVAEYCAQCLRELGLDVRIDDAGETLGGSTGNVIATLPGAKGQPSVVLSAHMDTVQPHGVTATPVIDDQGVIWSDGSTVLGADDKAGLAAVIAAVEQLVRRRDCHGPITVVFTVAEELGFRGAKQLNPATVGADMGLVLDYSGPPGSFASASPAQARFEVIVEHAPFTSVTPHQRPMSLIRVATHAVAAMPRGRVNRDTYVSITSFQRLGDDGNRVQLVGQVSSYSEEKLERVLVQTETVFRASTHSVASTIRFHVNRLCDSYQFTAEDAVRRRAEQAIRGLGLIPRPMTSREGSDANVLSSLGIPTVNVGIGYLDMHTSREHVRLSDITTSAEIAYRFCCLE